MHASPPILVIDSGIGGLTVARALRAALPAENLIYFGDTARLPYGSKSAATVGAFVKQIVGFLAPLAPKHVVLACNTATALALPAVRAAFPALTFTGVVEPGAKAAIVAAGAKRVPVIAVIATEATVRSKAYERAILRRRNHARLILQPTPLLVPLVEEGRAPDDPVVRLALKQYLQPVLKLEPDVLVLGCTHYPMLKRAIVEIAGPGVLVIDSAEQCADDVARFIRARANSAMIPSAAESFVTRRGSMRCLVTDDPARLAELARRFLGHTIDPPRLVSLDDLRRAGDKAAEVKALIRMPA